MGHADFRVAGRIFATLGWPDDDWGMVKLTPEEQALRIEAQPAIFKPVKGGWGLRGNTNVLLEAAGEAAALGAIRAAWRNAAPKRLAGRCSQRL
jgi:hypothetical protein